jgi:amino acid transporter
MNKNSFWIIFIISFVFAFSTFGNPLPTSKQLKNKDAVVKSLLIGINSENYGLRTSSAYMLGELEFSESVIPLMKMLRDEENEEARIMAAVSLFKIGDARGIFAVKQAIRFDDSERVRKMCEKIYNTFRFENSDAQNLLAGL